MLLVNARPYTVDGDVREDDEMEMGKALRLRYGGKGVHVSYLAYDMGVV